MAINPSPRLALLLLLIHAVAAAGVYVAQLPLAVRLTVLVLVLSSLSYNLARDALLLFPGSWHEISLDHARVSLLTRSGVSLSGELAGTTVASPYFAVLCIRLEGRRLPVFRTIFPDALGKDAYRRLCVRLRFSQ